MICLDSMFQCALPSCSCTWQMKCMCPQKLGLADSIQSNVCVRLCLFRLCLVSYVFFVRRLHGACLNTSQMLERLVELYSTVLCKNPLHMLCLLFTRPGFSLVVNSCGILSSSHEHQDPMQSRQGRAFTWGCRMGWQVKRLCGVWVGTYHAPE
jgi:hypothetical protein